MTITAPRFLRRRKGKHRVANAPLHQGWEGREHEIPLLLAGRTLQTTTVMRGFTAETVMRDCPFDQCTWPDDVYAATGHHARLLEHVHEHAGQDVINTVHRLGVAVTKWQDRS